jgi:hypothetical protein
MRLVMVADDLEELESERKRVAERLRKVREQVRESSLLDAAGAKLPEPRPVADAEKAAPLEQTAPGPLPARPDATAVNEHWRAVPTQTPRGLRGWLARRLRRGLAPSLEAQVAFNSHQVQLDNAVLDYIDARVAATHAHYDAVLGRYGRHLGEVDERHMILQEELVAHVHDLVKRIDLVLSEAERGRLSLEFALREVRQRLARVEESLKGE